MGSSNSAEKKREYNRKHYLAHRDGRKRQMVDWRKANPRKVRLRDWKRVGIHDFSWEDYERLLIEQQGRCALCETRPLSHVDHDHATGTVRGLLCRPCNLGLGLFDDSPVVLARAIQYLE